MLCNFKLSWFLIIKLGILAVLFTKFYTKQNAYLIENYLKFAVYKNDDMLNMAKKKLR